MPVDIGGMILQGLGIIFLLIVAVCGLITRNFLKSLLIGSCIFAAMIAITLIYITSPPKNNYDLHKGIDITSPPHIKAYIKDGQATWNKAADQAEIYLSKICQSEERFSINETIPLGSSIYLNLPLDQNASTAQEFLEQSSKSSNAGSQRDTSWLPAPQVQYVEPIRWIRDANRPETIAKLVGSDLIDFRVSSGGSELLYKRLATKNRWEKDGQSATAVAFTEKLLDGYKFHNWPDGKLVQAIPIDKPKGQYELTVVDISTVDDRNNWLARGKIRLFDTMNSRLIAEYTGFQSIFRKGDVCPNAKKAGPKADGDWDILGFFFGRIVTAPKDDKSSG